MENFNNIINSKTSVLVDFYATWCGPCKTLSPILEEFKEQYDGKITILKIDVDENPELALKYNIKSVPTLITFKDGQLLEVSPGFQGKGKIEDLIKASF